MFEITLYEKCLLKIMLPLTELFVWVVQMCNCKLFGIELKVQKMAFKHLQFHCIILELAVYSTPFKVERLI